MAARATLSICRARDSYSGRAIMREIMLAIMADAIRLSTSE